MKGWDKLKQRCGARAGIVVLAMGLTCIDCHFGIAHHEAEGPGPQELKPER